MDTLRTNRGGTLMSRMHEIGRLRDDAIEIIENEISSKNLEEWGYKSSFEFYMKEFYLKLYQWRFRNDFAYLLYEMYQTS
jgi:hypothetical protein